MSAEAARAGRVRQVAFPADADGEAFLVLGDDRLGQLLDLSVAQVREAVPVAGVFRVAVGRCGVLTRHGAEEAGVIRYARRVGSQALEGLLLRVAEEGLPGLQRGGVDVEGALVEEHGR